MENNILERANLAFNTGDYKEAERLYADLVNACSPIAPYLFLNLKLSRERQGVFDDEPIHQMMNKSNIFRHAYDALKKPLLTRLNLKPYENIFQVDDFEFESTSNDPYFLVEYSKLIEKGFYVLQLEIDLFNDFSFCRTALYVDYGNGFNDNDTLLTLVKSKISFVRVIEFQGDVRSIRFDPLDSKCKFSIVNFKIARIDEKLAQELMILTLIENDQKANQYESISAIFKQYDYLFNSVSWEVGYKNWINEFELKNLPEKDSISNILKQDSKPLFSILLTTYNTPIPFLHKCIESVLVQSYTHWELCIADDCSSDDGVINAINEYVSSDSRVKFIQRNENGNISVASNTALDMATGDYVVLLDHDDELADDALYFVAKAIVQYPNLKYIYSDEDKIDEFGNRSNPHFKSDWNPDLFLSQNYTSHLSVIRRSLVNSVGGFRLGVEGAQDQDLFLRCTRQLKDNEIYHIPRVLYHWRTIKGSTALSSSQKSYTADAGLKALESYITTNDLNGVTVEKGLVENSYKVNWPIPSSEPLVSLLIPTRDRMEITKVALDSILEKTTYQNYEIIILDNGSVEDKTLEWFNVIQDQDSRVKVLRYDYPFNFSAINNYGVEHAKGSVIGLINNDIEVISPNWLTEMVSLAIRDNTGCVGAKLLYSNDLIQHAGVIIGLGGVAGHSHKMYQSNHSGYYGRLKLVQNLSAVTAAVLLVKKSVYEEVGGLDAENLKVAFNDVDFCLKVRKAGYLNVWTPYAELYHHESISRGAEDTPEKQVRFQQEIEYMKSTWGDFLQVDPYYNPHLTLDREDFSIGINFK